MRGIIMTSEGDREICSNKRPPQRTRLGGFTFVTASIVAQEISKERKEPGMVARPARQSAIFEFGSLEAGKMPLNEPLGFGVPDGNCRGALKSLFAIEEVETGIAALVDPVAVHRPLFPRQ